jgi:hypothetical protein
VCLQVRQIERRWAMQEAEKYSGSRLLRSADAYESAVGFVDASRTGDWRLLHLNAPAAALLGKDLRCSGQPFAARASSQRCHATLQKTGPLVLSSLKSAVGAGTGCWVCCCQAEAASACLLVAWQAAFGSAVVCCISARQSLPLHVCWPLLICCGVVLHLLFNTAALRPPLPCAPPAAAGVNWQATYADLAKLSDGRHFSGFEGMALNSLLDINMNAAVGDT